MNKFFAFMAAALAAGSLIAADAQTAPEAAPAEVEPIIVEETAGGDWSVSLGAAVRNFHHPRMKATIGGSFSDQLYLGSAFVPENITNVKAAAAEQGIYSDPGIAKLKYGSLSAGDINTRGHFDLHDNFAPVIGFSNDFYADDALTVSLVANFQFFNVETKDAAEVSDCIPLKTYAVGWNGDAFTRGEYLYDSGDVDCSMAAGSKFDMDLYVLDAGLSLGYNFDNGIRAFVSAGPTLSIADIESNGFGRLVINDAVVSANGGKSNSTQFKLGCYISTGASYWFSEALGISAEVRYDDTFDAAETRYAKQNLDSWGGMLRMMARF